MDAARATRWRQIRIAAAGVIGGSAAYTVSHRGGGVGVPLSDITFAAVVAAAIAAFPRVLVGALLGSAVALLTIRGGSGWDRWRDAVRIVTWGTILGAVSYTSRWGLDMLADVGRAARVTVERFRGAVAASWQRGADGRRHPVLTLRRHGRAALEFVRSEREQLTIGNPPWAGVTTSHETILVLSAAALYALARLGTDRFYARFDVAPEEAGITTPSLLLGAAGAVVVLVVAVGAGAWALRVALRVDATRFALFSTLGFAIGVSGAGSPNWGDGVIGAAVGVAAWWFTTDTQIGRHRPGWRTWATLATVSLLLAVGATVEVSDSAADRVDAGDSNEPSLGPFMLTPLHTPAVSVWAVGDTTLPEGLANGSCATLLGVSDGVAVLHRAGYTWRLATDAVIFIGEGCTSGD